MLPKDGACGEDHAKSKGLKSAHSIGEGDADTRARSLAVVHGIGVMEIVGMGDGEASELSVFDAVYEARRRASVQDQAKFLRDRFLILERR